MAGLRHDAAVCRGNAKSERLRIELGILTPEEKARKAEAEDKKRKKQAKEAAKGTAILDTDV
jgi:hypothetical protein